MPSELELKAGERAAREAAPGMGGFSQRLVAKAVLEAAERVRPKTWGELTLLVCRGSIANAIAAGAPGLSEIVRDAIVAQAVRAIALELGGPRETA